MANIFPTLASGAMVVHGSLLLNSLMKHPSTLHSAWLTRTIKFLGDQEQAWTVHQKLAAFQLEYRGVDGYDLARVQDLFRQLTARYVDDALLNTFSMSILGVTYNWLVFDQDSFDVEEEPDKPEVFNFALNVRQVRPN